MTATAHVDGLVAPGFEEVRVEFERNFAERGEIGAAVAAYWRGEKVVDLWGGRRIPGGTPTWNEDTMVVVMSTTKGLAAMTLAIANARGWLDYDAPVARYWPEFAQNGKAAVTVRQLLGHEAGIVLLDEKLSIEKLSDLDYVACVFGAPGAGGSFAFADPDARVGFAYVMNKLDFYLENDPREKALRDAVYRAIARLSARTRAVELVGVP